MGDVRKFPFFKVCMLHVVFIKIYIINKLTQSVFYGRFYPKFLVYSFIGLSVASALQL